MIKNNIKIKVTKEQSIKIQEICFANKVGWAHSGQIISNELKPFLQIYGQMLLYIDDIEAFKEKDNEEVDADLFIKTNGTCIESKVFNNAKEYLVSIGAYDKVLEQNFGPGNHNSFSGLFDWSASTQGHLYWQKINNELVDLELHNNIDEILEDYKYLFSVAPKESKNKQVFKSKQVSNLETKILNQREEIKQLLKQKERLELNSKNAMDSVLKVVEDNEELKEFNDNLQLLLDEKTQEIKLLQEEKAINDSFYRGQLNEKDFLIEYLEKKLGI